VFRRFGGMALGTDEERGDSDDSAEGIAAFEASARSRIFFHAVNKSSLEASVSSATSDAAASFSCKPSHRDGDSGCGSDVVADLSLGTASSGEAGSPATPSEFDSVLVDIRDQNISVIRVIRLGLLG